MPEETVKRIPIGGGLGVLFGFAVGAVAYAWLRRPPDELPSETDEESDAVYEQPEVKPR